MISIPQAKEIIGRTHNQQFIEQHLHHNTARLALKYHGDAEKTFLVEQIAARQRIRKKLPTWYQNNLLILPPTLHLEQSSSASAASLKSRFFSGGAFTDLTAGMGADFSYFAPAFKSATYVEPAPRLFELSQYNLQVLGLSFNGLRLTAEEALEQIPAQDLIYLDPSRRQGSQRLVSLQDYAPDAVNLENRLMQKAEQVLIKTSPMLSITETARAFANLAEVWVISVKNECKEVLFLLSEPTSRPRLKTWNLGATEEFYEGHLNEAPVTLNYTEPADFIYQPNASILKAGLADALAAEMQLSKLHPNSNLYTASSVLSAYPGKCFAVNNLHKPFTKSLRKKRFNVISRNFPQKASTIEAKLGLKPADKEYLLATQTLQRKIFISCTLVNGPD